jgi:hypothetical protein
VADSLMVCPRQPPVWTDSELVRILFDLVGDGTLCHRCSNVVGDSGQSSSKDWPNGAIVCVSGNGVEESSN